MAIPVLSGFQAGEKVTAAKLNEHTKQAIEEAVYYKPFCHLQNAAPQLLASSTTNTMVSVPTIIEDTEGMAATANRITITAAGLYRVTFQMAFNNNAAGARGMFLWKNGATTAAAVIPAAGGTIGTNCGGAKTMRLNVGDFLQIGGWQTSGVGTVGFDTANGGCYLQAEWVSL
ncbi:hypothetical protein [Micromonospora coerulea]|uniref:hypothetical protein n=1 Tax=Micromonospora coerulea TaxID=47856 RepID=UPI0019033CA8|nr:hypothetical protein [Micromonospora veneta]